MFPILVDQLLTWARRPAHWPRRAGTTGMPRRASPAASASTSPCKGGGAHGAFTWGVLDQLLADGRLTIEGISGTSAGAVNAVMLADGLARGGPEEARARLADFWRAVSVNGHLPDLQRRVAERLFSFVPQGAWLGALSRVLSPYDLNPLNINPLKDLIEHFVDFDALRRERGRELFISATDVRTGARRVFTREEISAGGGDGLGLPAAPVPRGRDRRRAVLGRRLQRQPGAGAVPARDRDRRRAGGADQSARAAPRRRCRRARS